MEYRVRLKAFVLGRWISAVPAIIKKIRLADKFFNNKMKLAKKRQKLLKEETLPPDRLRSWVEFLEIHI
jgi:hypothetical protein